MLLLGASVGVFSVSPACGAPAVTAEEKRLIGGDVPCQVWINADKKTKAVLLCIHGLSLHSGSFSDFGKEMSNLGYPTYAMDVRGFGAWQQTDACSRLDFKAAFDDIKGSIESIRLAHPGVPLVLLGESMGGALALQAASENQDLVDGLICSVPASKRAGQKLTEAKVAIGMITAPNKQLKTGAGVVKRATTDPELANVWTEDPLARMNLSPKELLAFAVMSSKNTARAQELKDMPVLFVQGGSDKLIKPIGTYDLFNKIKSPHKKLLVLGEWEHLIFEDEQFDDEVMQNVSSWIDMNVVAPARAKNLAASATTTASGTEAPAPTPEQIEQSQAHLKIAQGFLQLKQPKDAEHHLLQSIAGARGSDAAFEAESLLCALPHDIIQPDTGTATTMSDEEFRYITKQQALGNDKPTVILFTAKWIKTCEKVRAAADKALAKHGGKINFVVLDADAKENLSLITRYKIKPLPSVLYLDGDNTVVGYTIGYPGDEVIERKVSGLMVPQTQPVVPVSNSPSGKTH